MIIQNAVFPLDTMQKQELNKFSLTFTKVQFKLFKRSFVSEKYNPLLG